MKKKVLLTRIFALVHVAICSFGQSSTVTMVDNPFFYYGTFLYSCNIEESRKFPINGTYESGPLWDGSDGGSYSNGEYLINGRPAYRGKDVFLGGEGVYKNIGTNVCVYSLTNSLHIWWRGTAWVLGYIGPSGGALYEANIALSNGMNTIAPPCEGWPGGGRLTGNCQTFSVRLNVPGEGPAVDPSKTVSEGVVNDKNAYRIPTIDNTGYILIFWDGAKWIMEYGNSSPVTRMANEELSVNTSYGGANPPCTGWSNGYELGGAICEGGETGLPINLFSFEAQATPRNVVTLNWSTAAEQNASHFGIERSADARIFGEIATVAAKGDSYEIKSYIHTDETPLRGRSYYRLRQVDLDGSYTYSKVVSVRTTGTDAPYPNPARGGTIRIEARDAAALKLTDISGRDIPFTHKRIDEKVVELQPFAHLQPGVYVISKDGVGYRVVVE